jgi:uncharacterized protein YbjT (DUF2867 family)
MSTRRILVTGATGKTGRSTAELLLGQGVEVRALVHADDARAEQLRDLGAETVTGDLLHVDDVRRALAGVSAAYFVYPVRPGLIEATAYFAHEAKRAGVELVVNMSQISARWESESRAARDHWIAERVFDWSGAPVTHLRPTFFAEWLLSAYVRPPILEEGVIRLPFGNGKHAPIATEDQARLIAAVLADPVPHRGQTYRLCGPTEMTYDRIAGIVGDVIGREVRYEPGSIDDFRAHLTGLHVPEFVVQHLCAVARDCQNGIFEGTDDVIERVTGRAPMTVREFVSANRGSFVQPLTGAGTR